MKKFLMLAVAALALVALSAVAVAQVQTTHTMDVSVTPIDAGTAKKPKNGTVNVSLKTPQDREVTVDKFVYYFPSQLKVSTKGFKYCTVENITENGNTPPTKCNKAKVGKGLAIAYVGSRAGQQVTFDTTLFANKGGLTVYVAAREFPDLRQAFPATLSASDRDEYKQMISADIPTALEFPAGAPAILDSVDLQMGPKTRKVTRRVKGKKRTTVYRLVSVRGCAANNLHTVGTGLIYADDPRNADPAPATTFAQDTTPCTK